MSEIAYLLLIAILFIMDKPKLLLTIAWISILVVFIFSKFYKQILKASLTIVVLILVVIIVGGIVIIFKNVGVGAFIPLGLLLISAIMGLYTLIRSLIDKIPNFKDFFPKKGGLC